MPSLLLAILVLTPIAGLAWAGHHEGPAELPRHASSKDAVVYIIGPKDGAALSSPVRVLFGLRQVLVSKKALDR